MQSRDVLAGNGRDDYTGLLPLTARDRKKAAEMLERSEILHEGGSEAEWRRELQIMLMLNVKARLEVLAEREEGAKGWVEERLLENGTGSHADEDLLESHDLAETGFAQGGLSGLEANEDILLDAHETPEMSAVGEDFLNLQADEGLFGIHPMADMSLADDRMPFWERDDEL